jgi:hypothetical protein
MISIAVSDKNKIAAALTSLSENISLKTSFIFYPSFVKFNLEYGGFL